jgi:hypothetical protein
MIRITEKARHPLEKLFEIRNINAACRNASMSTLHHRTGLTCNISEGKDFFLDSERPSHV